MINPPWVKKDQLVRVFGLSAEDANRLARDAKLLDYFEETLEKQNRRDQLFCGISAKWILNDLLSILNKNKVGIEACPVSAKHFGSLLSLLVNKKISGTMAKNLLEIMWVELSDPETIMKELELDMISDEVKLSEIVSKIFKDFPAEVEKSFGNPKVSSFFIGQAMERTCGRADPKILSSLVKEKLESYDKNK